MKTSGDIEIQPISGGFVKIRKAGNVELNGVADFAVAYTDLKLAFDQLKTELNAFVTVFNGHKHTLVEPIPTTSGSSSNRRYDSSKSGTVLLP